MHARKTAFAFTLLALTAGAVACGGGSGTQSVLGLPADVLRNAASKVPIQHVVIVIQENRSFDNFFATFPGADGTTTGKAAAMPSDIAEYCQQNGQRVVTQPTTIPLTEVTLTGVGFPKNFATSFPDLYHLHAGYNLERDHGAMDGWDLSGFEAAGSGTPTCTYTYQYVNPSDIAPYWQMAKQYVLADHTFQTQGSGSFTSHQDLIAGGTQIASNEALIDNPSFFPWGCDANPPVRTAVIFRDGKYEEYGGPFPCLTYTTLATLLDEYDVSWKFYGEPVQKESGCDKGDTPGIFTAFDAIKAVRYSSEWGTKVVWPDTKIFNDIKNNQLPAVSWITPDGPDSDHPAEYKHKPCQIGTIPEDDGPSWVTSIVNSIGESAYWDSTAIVILWDDWGGYFDHMPPPQPLNWQGGAGFRVPMLIVSPYVKPHVDHTVYEFGSVLHFIENVWNLPSLGRNDETSQSIGNAFDFSMSPRTFQKINSKYSLEYFLHRKPSGDPPDTE